MHAALLRAVPLTGEAFAPYGDVIETAGRDWRWINDGTCRRYDDLAPVDVAEAEGRPLISIFRASPRPLPFKVTVLERHPLSSQAFVPLDRRPFLIVVAADGPAPVAARIRAFLSRDGQGVNFRRNTWHSPLVALGDTCDFLVVDRGGDGDNCEQAGVDGVTVGIG